MGSGRERDADPAGDDVANRHPHLRVVLEAIDGCDALLGVVRARDCDALVAKNGLVLLQSFGEGRENDHLPIRSKDVADALFYGSMLGLVECNPELGEAGKKILVVRPGWIRLSEPFGE